MIASVKASLPSSLELRIERKVQIEPGGSVVITDSLTLLANETNVELSNFLVGLPREYQANLFHYFAYDERGNLGVRVGEDLDGFFGLNVQFREPVSLGVMRSYGFTIVYVFSDLVLLQGRVFNVTFPLYPVLGGRVNFYNVTISLPSNTTYVNSNTYFGNFTLATPGYSYQILNRTENNVPPFANQTSWITFKHLGLSREFFLIELTQEVKEIALEPTGSLIVSNLYQITNKGESLSESYNFGPFYVPRNATEIAASDAYGSIGIAAKDDGGGYKRVWVHLEASGDEKIKLTIRYKLPFNVYVTQISLEEYNLKLDFLNLTRWLARRVILQVFLPEGVRIQDDDATFTSPLVFANVTRFHDLNLDLRYRYNFLWASFRPVSWAGVLSAIFCAVLFFKGKVKPSLKVTPIPSKTLRRFLEGYEERSRTISELKSLERQVKSGRLPKRRYRLRRSSLDNRLSKLQKEMAELRSEIEAVSGSLADMMGQLEVAEAELEALEEDIQRLEARFHRKELSAEARRKLLEEYARRRERAENTISGVILRLKENM